ncbi:MAG: sulfotransferase [Cyclobacteriaceae bacterium]
MLSKRFWKKFVIRFTSVFRKQPAVTVYNFLGANSHRRFSQLQTICFFIGHTRSGHTLLGSILDAHPQIVIATEANMMDILEQKGLTKKGLFFFLYNWSKFIAIFLGNRSAGYSYKVKGGDQGRAKNIRVIGDNKGKGTLLKLQKNPSLLTRLHEISGLDSKVIYCSRNPFDMISTQYLKNGKSSENINYDYLQSRIDIFKEQSLWIHRLIHSSALDIHVMHNEDLVSRPKEEIEALVRYLDVPYTNEFIEKTSGIIFEDSRKTRFKIEWAEELIKDLEDHCQTLPFLTRYNYQD